MAIDPHSKHSVSPVCMETPEFIMFPHAFHQVLPLIHLYVPSPPMSPKCMQRVIIVVGDADVPIIGTSFIEIYNQD